MVECGVFPCAGFQNRMSDFSGKFVGTISSSQLFVDPDISEAHTQSQWFDSEGRDAYTQFISRDVIWR
jgi:replication factor A1